TQSLTDILIFIGVFCYEIKTKNPQIHRICGFMTSFSVNIVGVAGFEPATSWSQTRRDNRATLHPEECGETGTRTLATVTRRQISNLLRYHSGTSPLFLNVIKNLKAVANV